MCRAAMLCAWQTHTWEKLETQGQQPMPRGHHTATFIPSLRKIAVLGGSYDSRSADGVQAMAGGMPMGCRRWAQAMGLWAQKSTMEWQSMRH